MAATAFSIKKHAMVLGYASDTVAAAALQVLPPEPVYLNWRGETLAAAFVFAPVPEQPFGERLLDLLASLQQQLDGALNNQTVYLILPEYTEPDSNALNSLLQQLMRRFPEFIQSQSCRVFPHGSAGVLMALSAAQQHISTQGNEPVWLVAVDSMAQASVLDAYATGERSGVPSEGAIALCLTGCHRGVTLQFSASDAQPATTVQSAVAALFLQLTANLKTPLKQLYFPDCGDPQVTEQWLAQYQHLHGVVDSETSLIFPSYATGELGACGGLYRLWHVLQAYEQGRITGQTVQCELSARLFRAVAVFSPSQALLDNKDV
ncbi:hypothetical protein [Rheinheimera sp. EpRS3]|uniref:hypothetical protein n=1 Tax=Rheinheimera sp. EpRS3 TaxID=1712383 RepID=UPI0007496EE6|nr:hypothetical protein [Rheinheimera sp. EpRS3]KUM53769.1 hypothetical protein AR688_19110 [Rheinheimera sp. EpRS3]